MPTEAEIDIRTEGLRNFADTGPRVNYAGVRGTLTNADGCSGYFLPGCGYFKSVDARTTTEIEKILTRADQLVNGILHAAKSIAGKYDETDGQVFQTLSSVAPREPGLPQVDAELELEQRFGAQSSR